jgi:hypothetical protein
MPFLNRLPKILEKTLQKFPRNKVAKFTRRIQYFTRRQEFFGKDYPLIKDAKTPSSKYVPIKYQDKRFC